MLHTKPNWSHLTPQPSNVYKRHSDPHYAGPRGSCGRDRYESDPCVVPVAADTPHMMITVLEPAVAPDGHLLWSEFNAIIALLESRIRMGHFTDHHTKPVRRPLLSCPDLYQPTNPPPPSV